MKKNIIKSLLLIILLLLAVLLGRILGSACEGIKFLSWLGAAANFGLSPMELNLSVVRFTFGMIINVNVAQAILLLISIFSYTKINIMD